MSSPIPQLTDGKSPMGVVRKDFVSGAEYPKLVEKALEFWQYNYVAHEVDLRYLRTLDPEMILQQFMEQSPFQNAPQIRNFTIKDQIANTEKAKEKAALMVMICRQMLNDKPR